MILNKENYLRQYYNWNIWAEDLNMGTPFIYTLFTRNIPENFEAGRV